MTKDVKWIIDQKDEEGLRSQISILEASRHKNKDELIEYCEERLERLNRVVAMVEMSEVKVGEI